MRFQVGRAERPERSDERFETLEQAVAAARIAALGDFVIAVWEWITETTPVIRCLVYEGDVYTA